MNKLTVMAAVVAALTIMAGEARADIYCKTVIGEVEGFGQDYTRFSAERSREEAIEAELARRREMGREVVKVEREESTCEAVYPLGFEEWYCIAKADVCVDR